MSAENLYDVAIVGGGPAGLSAALVLGRSCRRVVVVDHNQPRNKAAQSVHGYLGVPERSPHDFREQGRQHVQKFNVELCNAEVLSAECAETSPALFLLKTSTGRLIRARKLLLATGTRDILPEIENCAALFGRAVHHCPYCDGWEHRGQRLVALGEGSAAFRLAMQLRTWSQSISICSHGKPITAAEAITARQLKLIYRSESVTRFNLNREGQLESVSFERGEHLPCDAVFFSSGQTQTSGLASTLGCPTNKKGLLETETKQHTRVAGLYIAGDADGDVQFAIVAAAEGAVAGSAINRELQEEDLKLLLT